MTTSPSIILTRLDVQRLEKLIETLDDSLPGVIAYSYQAGDFSAFRTNSVL